MRVGFDGSQEPVLKEFGDLYANFLFSGSGGSMEVWHRCLSCHKPTKWIHDARQTLARHLRGTVSRVKLT